MSLPKKSLVVPAQLMLSFILTLILAAPGWAQPLRPALVLEPDDVVAGDAFGGSVEAAGSLLLVAAPGDRSAGFPGGALYVFERDRTAFGWHLILEIWPEHDGQEIGAVATDGQSFAYVLHTSGSPAAQEIRLWHRGAEQPWEQAAALDADQAILDLEIQGDDLVVLGSPSESSQSLLQSFRVAGVWQPLSSEATFSPGQAGFDLQGDLLMVGSTFSRRAAPGNVFPAPQGFRPPASAVLGEGGFGSTVAFSGDGRWLAMGSGIDTLDGELSGSVYLFEVFESGAPVLVSRLAPSDAGPQRRFGAAVRFDGNRLAVSAPGDPQGISPKTHVFEIQETGQAVETHQTGVGEPRLAIAGDALFVGAPSSDIYPSVGGSVLVYSLQEIVIPPRVTLDPIAPCPAQSPLTVSGQVTGSEAITRLTRTIDGGPEDVLCTECGTEPGFQFPVDLLTCQDNEIVVTAQDALGQSHSAGASVYFDDTDPVIVGCDDQTLQIPEGDLFADAEQPTASDACEIVDFSCTHGGEYAWPRFPIGADQPASCTAIDRCGRRTTCNFAVTVEELPSPTVIDVQFDTLPDGVLPAILELSMRGPGSGSAEIADGKLEISRFVTTRVAEATLQVTQTVIGTTRVETRVPEPQDGAEEGEGGLIVSAGDEPESPQVRVTKNIQNSLIEFKIRQDGGPMETLTSPVSADPVTDLAIEVVEGAVTVEISLDHGQSWLQPEGGTAALTTLDLPLKAGLFVGLPAGDETLMAGRTGIPGAQKSIGATTFTFDYLKISRPEPPPCRDDNFNDDALDPAWSLVGVGNANVHSAVELDGELRLTANGSTAFYAADNAGFFYRQITGDFRMETTIDGHPMTNGGKFRKAGLMVRQSLDTWDIRLLAFLVPYWQDGDETHLQFAARRVYGAPGYHPVAHDVVGVPRVVRLAIVREGQTLSVEYSTDDGSTWIRPTTGLGGSVTIDDLAPTLLVGLGMVSNNVSETSTAHFDEFSLCRP